MTFPGTRIPSSVSAPARRELGDRCPNCDYPIPDPKAKAMEAQPSHGHFVCDHCGWRASAPRFEEVR